MKQIQQLTTRLFHFCTNVAIFGKSIRACNGQFHQFIIDKCNYKGDYKTLPWIVCDRLHLQRLNRLIPKGIKTWQYY